ncbi:MAG: hypothetical protein WCJ26_15035 [bacterium]
MKTKHLILCALCLIVISSACKKKSSDPEQTYYYANAQIKGVNNVFKTSASFSKFCILTSICNTFYTDPLLVDKNCLMIGLPATVKAGVTYTSDSSHTQMMYIDNAGRKYYSSQGDSLSISVTKWEGQGGTGAGTFFGKFMYEIVPPNTPDSIYIKSGSFSSRIWFVTGK